MDPSSIRTAAIAAFAADLAAEPSISLRGGDDIDSYRVPEPFDARADECTDEYIEVHAFNGLGFLDAPSWRHYLPRLIDYALRHPDDPRMAVESLIRSLRPPDLYPPRLGSLDSAQETVVREFLEHAAFEPAFDHVHEEAQQALEEWWLPNPRSRPSADRIAALRAEPVRYRDVHEDIYHLELPTTLSGSAIKEIPEETRRVRVWGGYLCGDAHAMVAVNITPLSVGSIADWERKRQSLFNASARVTQITVPGATDAIRMDGVTGPSAAEPQTMTLVLAAGRKELVTLSVRAWPREDIAREVERIVGSLRVRE
jgi:hypothetical protein